MRQVQQATLIYNPRAGSGNSAAIVELAAESWRARGWQVSVRATQFSGHAIELAAQSAAEGHQLVIAAGGDGTLGQVANGLMGTETVMAPLPVGTANSFGKELGLPRLHPTHRRRTQKVVDALARGLVQRVDLGLSKTGSGKEKYWLLWTGTGADGFLVEQLEPRRAWLKRLGRVGYFTETLLVAPRLPQMRARVEVDGVPFADEFLLILISNCRRYAGGELMLSPKAIMDDGSFEIWLFRGAGVLKALGYFGKARLGRHQDDCDITTMNCRQVTITTEPIMPCQSDGEPLGSSPLSCEVVPGALRLLVPGTAPPGLFNEAGQPFADLVAAG